jgi:hypothetical protein
VFVRLSLALACLLTAGTTLHAQTVSSPTLTSEDPPLRSNRIEPLEPVEPNQFNAGRIQPVDQRTQLNKIGTVTAPLKDQSNAKRQAEDAFAPLGLRLGSFNLFPTLDVTGIATSNARRDPSEVADAAIELKPAINFQSDWSRHSLSGTASTNAIHYLRTGDANGAEGQFAAALRIDVMADTSIDATLDYNITSERAETDLAGETATGSQRNQDIVANLSLTRRFGSLSATVGTGVERNITGDADLTSGNTDDNDDRAFTRGTLRLRADYDYGAVVAPFAAAAVDRSFFDQSVDRDGLRRDAFGAQGEIGVTFDDALWTGSVSLIGGLRRPDDDALGITLVAGLNADVAWRPTELTSVNFNTSTTLEESTNVGAAATQKWAASVNVTQQLHENLNLLAGWSSEIAAGEDVDLTFGSRLGLSWNINREMALTSGYEGTFFRSGESSAENYVDHRVLTTLQLRR